MKTTESPNNDKRRLRSVLWFQQHVKDIVTPVWGSRSVNQGTCSPSTLIGPGSASFSVLLLPLKQGSCLRKRSSARPGRSLGEALFGVRQQIQDIPDSLLDTKPCCAPQAAGEARLPECLTSMTGDSCHPFSFNLEELLQRTRFLLCFHLQLCLSPRQSLRQRRTANKGLVWQWSPIPAA